MGEFIKILPHFGTVLYQIRTVKMGKKKPKKEQIQDKIKYLENLGKIRAKELTQKATKWEKELYKILKDLHYKFTFQVPVIVNKLKSPQLFILDFLLTDYNIFIELDGSQHYTKQGLKKDNLRTKKLRKEGYEPIRFPNKQISVFTKEQIDSIIKTKILVLNLEITK